MLARHVASLAPSSLFRRAVADLRARRAPLSPGGRGYAVSSTRRESPTDPWAAASQRRTKGGPAVLLVEKVASVSDVVIGGGKSRVPAGGLEDFGTPLDAGKSIRLTLLDKSFLDLEAPFREASETDQALTSAGLSIEDAFLSPSVIDAYHKTKPHDLGAVGLDVTNTRVFLQGGEDHRPDAPYVSILQHASNISGEEVLKVRILNNSASRDRQAEIYRRPSKILTGNPVTSELYLDSSAEKVKACLR
jgi:hypothetical protein